MAAGPSHRYHPALVVLHWLLAALILFSLGLGLLVLEPMANGSPEKLFALRGHMIGGLAILALMVVRFAVRVGTRRPQPASTGSPLADRLAGVMHYTLYGVVVLMALSGIALAVQAGLPDIVFRGSGAPLPESFAAFRARAVHGVLAWLLFAAIGLHVAAALFHQLVRHDRLLSRMGFGKP
jgi:cytochrome b561